MLRKPRTEVLLPKKKPRQKQYSATELDELRPISPHLGEGTMSSNGKEILFAGCCGYYQQYCCGEERRCRYENHYDVRCALRNRLIKEGNLIVKRKKRPR